MADQAVAQDMQDALDTGTRQKLLKATTGTCDLRSREIEVEVVRAAGQAVEHRAGRQVLYHQVIEHRSQGAVRMLCGLRS